MSLICGALKWLVDSEEREKAKIAAVLAGKLPPSVLEESTQPAVSHDVNHEDNDSHGRTTERPGNISSDPWL